jgi:ABC-type Fe3+ transport system substrate-binding protein
MSKRVRTVPTVIAAVVLVASAAACSARTTGDSAENVTDVAAAGGMTKLVSAAKKEGSLLFYCTASQDKMAAWVKGFTAQYGIKVQIYRAPTNPLYQRFRQEEQIGKNQADMIQVSDLNTVHDASAKGWLAAYTPASAGDFPADSVVAGRAYPMYTTLSAVGWNTRLVPKDLQAKLDSTDPLGALLDPRLKGKIAVADVTAGGPQVASNSNIVYNQQNQYGWNYLKKLAQQRPTVLGSTTDIIDRVVSGDYWATLDGYSSVFAPQAVAGAPVAFRPLPTSSSAEFYLSAVAQAPHPHAARLFEEWATSLPAQTSLANVTQADVLHKGWKDTRKVTNLPWYRRPDKLWSGWATDPRLKGSQLTDFYQRWQSLFGKGAHS